MFEEPHLGQYFILSKILSCFLALSIDFLKSHFSFHRLPSSLKSNSLASSPHNGQHCPGLSCLSYSHLVFGQVHEPMLTHHQKLNQPRTGACYQPCLIVDGGIAFLRFSRFLTPLNLLILTSSPSRATQYALFRC